MSLDFHRMRSRKVGFFSRESALDVVNNQFGKMGLPDKARTFFVRELDRGGNVTGEKFNKIVNEANRRGLISSNTAEKIKDSVKLPDNFNDHLK